MMCSICEIGNYQKLFSLEGLPADHIYRYAPSEKNTESIYYECDFCGVMHLPHPDNYEEIYDGEYYKTEAKANHTYFAQRFEKISKLEESRSDNVARINRIRNFLEKNIGRKSGAFLDIGSGMGIFPHFFHNEKWKGFCYEPDKTATEFIKSNSPFLQTIDSLEDSVCRSFDLVTYNRVLEHISRPIKVLSDITTNHLNPGGVVYVELPDAISYYSDGPSNQNFGYGHYFVYTPLSLSVLMGRAQLITLKIERVVDPSGKQTIVGFFGNKFCYN